MTRVIMICDRCAKEARALYDVPYLVVNPTSNKIEEGFVQGYELCEECARELVETVNHFRDTKKAEIRFALSHDLQNLIINRM